MSLKNRSCRLTLAIAFQHGLTGFALLLLLLIAPLAAQAGDKESKERAAKTACLSGDAAKGVALLAELFVATNNINHIFNQGRCFEQSGRYAEAITRFREYQLKNRDAGKAPDANAERHIAECQALIDKQTPAPAQPAPPAQQLNDNQPMAPLPPATQPAGATVPSTPAATPPSEVAQAAPVSASPGSGLRIAGIAAMGVGVAGIATGVILNLKANSLASELEKSPTSYTRSQESTRSSYQTFGWVGYGAGAACVVGGAFLYYFGHSQNQSTQIALVPTAQSGQIGAVLQGAF